MRYLSRVSGPFIDRIDLQIELPRLNSAQLQSTQEEQSSATVRTRVEAAYNLQLRRQGKVNARLNNKEMSVHCALAAPELQFLAKASEKLSLSPRSYHRVIKVARTISDLKGQDNISLDELKEALNYRAFERLLSQLTQY
jgi:magnesium chelatase family protein